MMAYVKIVFGLLMWGALLFYFGGDWLDNRREETCLSEVEQEKPALDVVKRRCLETAELYNQREAYGSAAWFYLLGGDVEKNIEELEPKIDNDFYMNIGHSYLLKGNFEKAKAIYEDYPWEGGQNYLYADSGMRHDFEILPRLYQKEEELKNLKRGVALWNEIYAPLEKVIESYNAYTLAGEKYETMNEIHHLKSYLTHAIPYRDREQIEYLEHQKKLAQLYFANERNLEAVKVYKEIEKVYENNDTDKYNLLDTLMSIANYYEAVPDYNSSLLYAEKFLKVSMESNNSDNYTPEVAHNMIGSIFINMNTDSNISLYEKALFHYQKKLAYVEKYKKDKQELLFESYVDVAKVEQKLKQFNEAEKHLKKAIVLKKD
jgi:tetratricopeptide (TPR) repeat protein